MMIKQFIGDQPMYKKISFALSALTLLIASHTTIAEPHYNVDDYYQVSHDGRIYIFDDYKTYASFNQLGETAYRLTRIGAGPNGETIVFGLTKKDKKMRSGIGSVALYEGKADGIADGFYAEVIDEGRIYVFSEWANLKSFLSVGEAPYRFTEIGSGPKAETVVYVLNKKNKKKKPVDLIAEFNKKHGI